MLFTSIWKMASWLDLFASMPWIISSFTFSSDTHWAKRRSNMTIMLPFLQSKKWHKRKKLAFFKWFVFNLCKVSLKFSMVIPLLILITPIQSRSYQILSLFHRWKKEKWKDNVSPRIQDISRLEPDFSEFHISMLIPRLDHRYLCQIKPNHMVSWHLFLFYSLKKWRMWICNFS